MDAAGGGGGGGGGSVALLPALQLLGRGLHSCTCLLNLSRFCQ